MADIEPTAAELAENKECQSSERIPLLTKMVFAAPNMGMLPFVSMFAIYGVAYYEKFGASLASISLCIALARSFDVVSDPLMSYLTDCTRTRFGRRRPYMLIGVVPYSVFLLLLMKPPYGSPELLSMWFGSMYILYFLSNTLLTIPYYALAPALSTDSDERGRLYFVMGISEAISMLFAVTGPMAATLMVKARSWNEKICKPVAEQAKNCFDSMTCGNVLVHGLGSAFIANDTLQAVLDPLRSHVDPGTLPDDVRTCTNWLKGNAVEVLGVLSNKAQNDEFCACMVTCSSACAIADERTGFEWVGWLFAGFILVSMVVCVLVVKERPIPKDVPTPPLVPSMFNTMCNGPFRTLLPAWACDAYCNAIIQCMTPFFVIIVTAPSYRPDCLDEKTSSKWFCDSTNVIAGCGLSLLFAAMLALPLWQLVVSKFGKIKAWWMWSISMAISNLFFLFLGSGDVIPLWIVSFINGLPMGAKFIADAILGDIIDYDELLTGQRSEATYCMFKGFLPKIVQIPASAVPIALLGVVGYVPPINGVDQQQAQSVVNYVKAVVCSAFVVSVVSFVLKLRYPLATDDHLIELRAGIVAHQQGMAYPDPVTKVMYKPIHVSPGLLPVYLLLDHFRETRIRVSFLDAASQHLTDEADLNAHVDIHAGVVRMMQTMIIQFVVSSVSVVISVVLTVFGMQLLTNPYWSFVPTFTSIAVGVSIVTLVMASLRLFAAKRLKTASENDELTPYIVTQVLLRRDLLGKVGVSPHHVPLPMLAALVHEPAAGDNHEADEGDPAAEATAPYGQKEPDHAADNVEKIDPIAVPLPAALKNAAANEDPPAEGGVVLLEEEKRRADEKPKQDSRSIDVQVEDEKKDLPPDGQVRSYFCPCSQLQINTCDKAEDDIVLHRELTETQVDTVLQLGTEP